jgi:uncharacterized protein
MVRTVLFVTALSAAAVGCGGAAADAIKPDMPTGSDALGGSECTTAAQDVDELWVVDLSGPKRNSLVNAMQKGLVFVSYDCKELKVVTGCRVKGLPARYEYGGTGHRKDVHELAGADMVRASLSGGAVIAAKLETELKTGTQLNIAYALVGMRSAPLETLAVNQLEGHCDGVTHFVAAAHLGAFRMTRGSSADVGAALKVFEQGVEASSSASEKAESEDGNGSICPRGETERSKELPGCDSPVELELRAISKTPAAEAELPPPPPEVPHPPRCGPGLVSSGGHCVPRTRSGPPTCKPGDPSGCESACKNGDSRSCALAGAAYEKGKGVQTDMKRAYGLYEKSCSAKDPEGCAGQGILLSRGDGVGRDLDRAKSMLEEACNQSSGRACSGRGHMDRITGDRESALRWLDRGCNLRYMSACYYAGALRDKKDDQRAYENHLRACSGGEARGCLAMSVLLLSGRARDPEAPPAADIRRMLNDGFLKSLDRRCEARDASSCEVLGDWYAGKYDSDGKVAPPQPDKAKAYYGKACDQGQTDACKDANASGPPKPGSPPGPPKGPPGPPPKGPPKGPPGPPPKGPPKSSKFQ